MCPSCFLLLEVYKSPVGKSALKQWVLGLLPFLRSVGSGCPPQECLQVVSGSEICVSCTLASLPCAGVGDSRIHLWIK